MQKVRFLINRAFWRFKLATGMSRKLTAWPAWEFCPESA